MTSDLPWKDGRMRGSHLQLAAGEAGALRNCPGPCDGSFYPGRDEKTQTEGEMR